MKVFSLIFAAISLIAFSDAHPGGLDANGGHYNRKTGEYHYHRKPAAKQQQRKKHIGSVQQVRPTTKAVDTIELAKGMLVIPPAGTTARFVEEQ